MQDDQDLRTLSRSTDIARRCHKYETWGPFVVARSSSVLMTQEATPEIARKGKQAEAAMGELQRTLGVLSMGNNLSGEQK